MWAECRQHMPGRGWTSGDADGCGCACDQRRRSVQPCPSPSTAVRWRRMLRRLITQRSQVQILPPLLKKSQVKGLITDQGGQALGRLVHRWSTAPTPGKSGSQGTQVAASRAPQLKTHDQSQGRGDAFCGSASSGYSSEEGEEPVDALAILERMAERHPARERVGVPPTGPRAMHVPLVHEVVQDLLRRSLGDADAVGQVAHPRRGVLTDGEENMPVVAQERPGST